MSSRVSFNPAALSTISFVAIATLITVCGSSTSLAQTYPLQPGNVSPFMSISPCPAGANHSMPLTIGGTVVAACYTTTVSGCQSYQGGVTIAPLGATVAISTPVGWNNSGTIFLHGGGEGTDYFDGTHGGTSYATEYYNAGFRVVQMKWDTDWSNNSTNPMVMNMKYDACRPFTILDYIHTNYSGGGAMCAQGHSAGSAAMAFALSWYKGKNYLNAVVLSSGPVYSDIQAGCEYPAVSPYTSPVAVCPLGQFGCIGNGWTDLVQYPTVGVAPKVAADTYPGSNCNGWKNTTSTTAEQNQDWHTMSITSNGANYSYPSTSLYAFLCATSQDPPNNSAAQGELFYHKFTSVNHPLNYGLYRVDNCGGNEKIWDGSTSDGPAFTVSSNLMLNSCHQ